MDRDFPEADKLRQLEEHDDLASQFSAYIDQDIHP